MRTDRYNLSETLARARQRLGYLGRTLHMVWHAAPAHATIWFCLLIVQGLLPAAVVSLLAMLVDRLLSVTQAGLSWAALQPALNVLVVLGLVLLLIEVVQNVIDWLRGTQSEIVQDAISALIHTQALAVDLAFFETPSLYDRLDRARGEASSRSLALMEHGGSLIQNGITLLAMAAVLTRFGIWLPLLLLLSALPALCVTVIANQRYHRWWERTTADRRRASYYDLLLTFPQAAPELRLFGLGQHFHAAYGDLRTQLRSARSELLRWQALVRLAASGLAMLVTALVALWIGWRAVRGLTTIGELVLFYQAFSRGQALMRSLLGNLGQIFSSALFLESLFSFLEERPQVVAPEQPVRAPTKIEQGIRFQDVVFQYPGSAESALDHFNLFVPAGSVVAVVGPNGAGKSTLVKLLCRFYDPAHGRVELDGVDLRALDPDELRRMITVLFQFPVRYHATARENIALSDLPAGMNQRAVEAAAQAAGIHDLIARLPSGYETNLGKWLADGAELSGGEWQRVALARAFLRRSPVIALDEPTSFMDSWAENDWLDRLRTLLDGRTALIITHRFTTAMRADLICVMDEGRVVEQGSHAELLARGGLYAQSWQAQMRAAHEPIDPNAPPDRGPMALAA